MKYIKPFNESNNEFYKEIGAYEFYDQYIDVEKKYFEEPKKYSELVLK